MQFEKTKERLRSQDADQRCAALDRLYSATPPELIPALLDLLKQQDPRTVGKARAVLEEYGLDRELVGPQFLGLLRSPDAEVRARACAVIRRISEGSAQVLGEICRLAADPYPYVRFLCVDILRKLEPEVLDRYLDAGSRPLSLWESELRSPSAGSRNRAVLALGTYGGAAVPLLRRELEAPDAETRHLALLALARIGPAAAEAMGVGLRDRDAGVREEAARALARGGDGAVDYLLRALRDEVPWVRATALKSLADLGEPAARAIPDLLPLLFDPDLSAASFDHDLPELSLRNAALPALAKLFWYSGPYADVVVESLEKLNPRLRDDAAFVAARSVRATPDEFAALLPALTDGDPVMRLAACVLLWSAPATDFATAVFLDGLAALAGRSPRDDYIRRSLFARLPRSTPQAVRFLPFVPEDGLRSWNPELRSAAERWLQSLEAPEATLVPALMRLLRNPSDELQMGAAEALSILGSRAAEAADALKQCLDQDDEEVRFAAARALSRIDPTRKVGNGKMEIPKHSLHSKHRWSLSESSQNSFEKRLVTYRYPDRKPGYLT